MTPKHFKQAQIELKKPADMTDEECGSLWIYRQDNQCMSLWTAPFMERLKFLFHGHIWIGVISGKLNRLYGWIVKRLYLRSLIKSDQLIIGYY